jgi:hypothetical protein
MDGPLLRPPPTSRGWMSSLGVLTPSLRILRQSMITTSTERQSGALVERGLLFYADRLDKEWSLTDCISFIVMADERLTEALTGDKHFQEAGFKALPA